MRNQRDNAPFYAKRTYRLVSGVFGTFLIGTGLYALLFAGPMTARTGSIENRAAVRLRLRWCLRLLCCRRQANGQKDCQYNNDVPHQDLHYEFVRNSTCAERKAGNWRSVHAGGV